MRYLIFAGVMAVTASASMVAYADRDEHERIVPGNRTAPAVVNNQQYATECGACHFAYQPGWLPARSWQKMMSSLQNHFGENAEMSAESRAVITAYLVEEAADKSVHRRSQRLLRGIAADEAPQRISELPYMQKKHDEIPARFVQGNALVGSLANCVACHSQAGKGYFDEHGVKIPGYGYWED